MPHVTGYLVCSVIFNLSLCPQRPIWQTAFPPGSHLPAGSIQDQQKLRKLKMALLPFKLRIKTIEPQDYSQPIGYLAGVKEISQVQIPSALIPQEQMEKEMLILAGITGNLFDQVLYTLRKAGTPVDYKAVLTEHNQNWNCMQLYKELEKEHNMYHPS